VEPRSAPATRRGPDAGIGARASALAHSAWPARVAWLVLPLLVAPVIDRAVAGASDPVRWVVGAGCLAVWVATLVATFVPSTLSLTVLRVAAPAVPLAVAVAIAAGGGARAGTVGIVAGLVAALVALAPATAEAFVDGSSYGDERRLPLRTPTLLLAGPVELVWLVVVTFPALGLLLVAAGRWLPGLAVLVLGAPLVVWCARSLHGLSRRWVVFVPRGFVLHDALALTEPILLRRTSVRSLAAAPADSEALDLTGGAAGLALEARMLEPLELIPASARGQVAELVTVDAVLFTPSRPGRVLDEARRRRIG
jgi:hypothetical protein